MAGAVAAGYSGLGFGIAAPLEKARMTTASAARRGLLFPAEPLVLSRRADAERDRREYAMVAVCSKSPC
jgi:hypothetical protein